MTEMVNLPLTPREIVRAAIRNTPAAYWATLCKMRAGHDPEREGSYLVGMSAADVDSEICGAAWDTYEHPAVQAPARAYRATMFGRLGIMPLAAVAHHATLRWSDPKNTGMVECVLENHGPFGQEVDFVVMLVGPDDEGRDTVWTFHPGAPIAPSRVARHQADGDLHGRVVTRDDAAKMGIEWVKRVCPPTYGTARA